ncbi:hypothetical protein GQ600_16146 [Phytophthora cactorum]|nr:hypothetical protein GQ600_16146 [Phytophthora cactorum]
MLIVHTHKYFLAEAQQRLDPSGTSCARARCQVFGGFGEHGCACTGCLQRTRREAFAVPSEARMPTKVRGRKLPRGYSEIINDPTPIGDSSSANYGRAAGSCRRGSDKVHCSNIMGEMDTSAQFEEFEIAL